MLYAEGQIADIRHYQQSERKALRYVQLQRLGRLAVAHVELRHRRHPSLISLATPQLPLRAPADHSPTSGAPKRIASRAVNIERI